MRTELSHEKYEASYFIIQDGDSDGLYERTRHTMLMYMTVSSILWCFLALTDILYNCVLIEI